MSKEFTPTEVSGYKDAEKGLYIIIDAGVYNVTGNSFTLLLLLLAPSHLFPTPFPSIPVHLPKQRTKLTSPLQNSQPNTQAEKRSSSA